MKFIGIYFVICILWKEILAERSTISLDKPARTDYFDGFIKYLKNESKLYRVVFILENQFQNADPMLNSLMKEVNQNFPSFSSNYNEISTWRERIRKENFDGQINYRSTTLFVFEAKNNKTMNSIGKELKGINFRTRAALPRCLIMNSFNSTHEYLNRTLHSLWRLKYLDITIMTYNEKDQVKPFLSHINPFTKTFTSQEITSKIKWFPDKVIDLKGEKFTFYYSTYSNDNDPMQKQWMEKRTTEIFAQAMNSKLIRKQVASRKRALKCKLQFTHINNFYSHILRIQKIDIVKAVIPKAENITKDLVFSQELSYMIMVTICMIIIIQITAFLMKFNRTTWQTLNISQIIIGMPANQEPNNCLERIVFGSLLTACIIYTGFFYSVILDISLQPVHEISTLEELADSSLIPRMDKFTFRQVNASASTPYLKKLLDKSELFNDAHKLKGKRCLKYLARHKNISCILPDAENQINAYSLSREEVLNVKILPEVVSYHSFIWSTQKNPPFSDFYNKIVQRATEFGLFNDVYCIKNVLPGKTSPPEEIKKEKLFYIISYVLGFGYSISTITFLFEYFIRIVSNRVCNLYTRFKFRN